MAFRDYLSDEKPKYTVEPPDISNYRQPHERFGDFAYSDPEPGLVKDFLTILNKKSGEYNKLTKNINDYLRCEKEIIKKNNEIKERNIKIGKSAPNFITGSKERHRTQINYLEGELRFLNDRKTRRFSDINEYYKQYTDFIEKKYKGNETPGTINKFIENVVNVSGEIMPNRYGGKSRKHRNKSRKYRNRSRKHRK